MKPDRLLSPAALGSVALQNRMVMAPMTRSRATEASYAPNALMAEYYAQRASAGLIISEGTLVSPNARGYAYTPGVYTEAQAAGWRRVTDAVHAAGGRIFVQLWHCGRVAHAANHEDGSPVRGASAIAAQTKVFVPDAETGGIKGAACDVPLAMSTEEARAVVADFSRAARLAKDAGFDGAEVHGANGYLFDQFRCPYLNDRADAYGGSLENRYRLLIETLAAVADVFGANRVGVRISPHGQNNDMKPDPEPLITYAYLAGEAQRHGLGFIHVFDQSAIWIREPANPVLAALRERFSGTLILCGGFDTGKAERALQEDAGRLVAFGKPFISNPDLVARFSSGAELAAWDQHTFYKGGAQGFTDYPRAG